MAGDYVLKEIGRIFLANKRAYELIGRYGGDEFVMILKQQGKEDALHVAERLRMIIEDHPFFFDGQRFRITVSIGITALTPTDQDSVESILSKADQAMYMSKEQGAISVSLFNPNFTNLACFLGSFSKKPAGKLHFSNCLSPI